ncbi:MAG TPA: hypothetical protein VMN78_09840 [Longimicrobiales bacterium]|nr:hypothetical protein [Longimicrobiales bacterium]
MPETVRRLAMPLLLGVIACGGADPGDEQARRQIDSLALAPPAPTGSLPDPLVAPSDTGPWMVERPAGATPDPSGWSTGASSGGTPGGITILRTVRTARHDGYDRVVFEFDSGVPVWRIDYVDSPQYECGSGEAVWVAGDGWLHVAFEPANAHTDEGRPTTQRRLVDPAGANLRELRRICDFEAHVDYVIGVGSPNPYRAFTLGQPARLVVDIRNRGEVR